MLTLRTGHAGASRAHVSDRFVGLAWWDPLVSWFQPQARFEPPKPNNSMGQEDVNNFADKMFNSSNCSQGTAGAAIHISLEVDSDEFSDDDMNNAKQSIADILG